MVSSSSPSTAARSPPPQNTAPPASLQAIPESNGQPVRRSSLGFLRRMKSGERVAGRSASGKLSKKQQALQHEESLRRERESKSKSPPRLPDLYNGRPPQPLRTFGDDTTATAPSAASSDKHPARASTSHPSQNPPVPPIPGTYVNARGEFVDPYARTESMTHRGRYSFASTAVSTINSPRRVRRRKDPTPFNILVIGAKNAGKTSFLEFLRSSLAQSAKHKTASTVEADPEPPSSTARSPNSVFTSQYIETDIDGERVGLTLWDSRGLEKNIVDLQLREMASFLESKFEDTFNEEMKVVRAPGVQDTHIHCVFLVLDPIRLDSNVAASSRAHQPNGAARPTPAKFVGGLDDHFDLQVLRTLQGKTTVIPVISKADTLTTAHMVHLKKAVWNSIKKANLDPLEVLGLDEVDGSSSGGSSAGGSNRNSRVNDKDDDEDDSEESSFLPKQSNVEPDEVQDTTAAAAAAAGGTSASGTSSRPQHRRTPSAMAAAAAATAEIPYLPLSIISPDMYDPGTIGRKFPWGMADPHNEEHCDFVRLKEAVFSDWRGELREASREMWYEGWRTSRLNKRRGR